MLLPRLPLSFLALFAFPQACQQVRHMRANGQEVGRSEDLPIWQHREVVIRLPDGWIGAPDRFRFPKTGTVVFLVRRPGVFTVVLTDPPQPEHPQALRRER